MRRLACAARRRRQRPKQGAPRLFFLYQLCPPATSPLRGASGFPPTLTSLPLSLFRARALAPKGGFTALFFAHGRLFEALLDAGADTGARNERSERPLQWKAASSADPPEATLSGSGRRSCVWLLLDRGDAPDGDDEARICYVCVDLSRTPQRGIPRCKAAGRPPIASFVSSLAHNYKTLLLL